MSERKRAILFVHPSDELYGSDRCLLDIVRGLPPSYRAVVALPSDLAYAGQLTEALRAAGATVEHIDMLVLRRSLLRPAQIPLLLRRLIAGTRGIRMLLRREDVRLVHSSTVAVVCGACAAALTRTPHLWHVHEHIGDEPLAYKAMIRMMLTILPGRIIANSRSVARALIGASGVRLRRTRVIENSVDPDIHPLDRSTRPEPVTPVIGVVGRLSPRKGISQAIAAARLLAGEGRRFELRFVGAAQPGREDLLVAYMEQVKALELDQHVTFAGQVNDVRQQLEAFDLLLFPSQRPESFGLVVVEAMAAGLPVVAAISGGGSDEILEHGVHGLYCGRDPESIAEALAALLDDRQRRLRMGRAASETVTSRYDLTRYQREFVSIYDHLIPAKS